MARYKRYLELAQQAKSTGDEIAVQYNLQHAEHWYRIAMADRSETDIPAALADGEIPATNCANAGAALACAVIFGSIARSDQERMYQIIDRH